MDSLPQPEMNDNVTEVKVLLIEDDNDTSTLMKLTLEREDFVVYAAQDGVQALNILEDIIPDVIVCDVMMPNMDGYQFRSMIAHDPDLELVPFIFVTALASIHDRIKGFSLNVDDYITKPFEPADLVLRVRTKLHKFKLYQRLIKYDNLTCFLNRRFFMTQLKKEIERVERYNRDCALIMFDVDGFKQVNDNFGHPVGDVVLESMARLIERNIRNTDIAGRYGGEEFVILMPETTKDQAVVAAEKLRYVIQQSVFTELKLGITISAGIASSPEDGNSVKLLLFNADRALLQAKRNGKNCVVAFIQS